MQGLLWRIFSCLMAGISVKRLFHASLANPFIRCAVLDDWRFWNTALGQEQTQTARKYLNFLPN